MAARRNTEMEEVRKVPKKYETRDFAVINEEEEE